MSVSTSRPKPGRAEKNAATTQALLRAAAQTFAERGFETATMDEIAERVGLSKGALYYRYRSKEDLFLALLDQRCAAYLAHLEAAAGEEVEPSAGWSALADHFLEIVREGSWPRLFFEFVSYSTRSPRARRELVKRTRRLREAIQRRIEEHAERTGGGLPVSAADLALAISALGNGLALERQADPRGVPDRAFAELPGLIIGASASRTKPGAVAPHLGANRHRGPAPASRVTANRERRSR